MYEKVEKFCTEAKISISAFERICGLSNGYIGKLKKSKPGIKAAARIAQVMGVTVDDLLSEEADL